VNDLTIIFYTANYISEYFAKNVRKQLVKAIGDIPIISVSQKPMDFGQNICVGDIGRNTFNIYQQVLTGTKLAKTKYVAMAEDDVLYAPQHFTEYRPPDDAFGYNMKKWGIFTWSDPPLFNYKHRRGMTSLICTKDLLIEALEERFTKYPDNESLPPQFGEPGRLDRTLGVTVRKLEEWNSSVPNIVFSHETALAYLNLGIKKKMGAERVAELPYWGKAKDIAKLYK